MKTARKVLSLSFVVACSQVLGCGASNKSEPLSESQQELDATATLNLTKTQGIMTGVADEAQRESDTHNNYYPSVLIGYDPSSASDGTYGYSVASQLNTLTDFTTWYGFRGSNETVAKYYNRGDLGIGREMHCVDALSSTTRQIACYVKNFAAGDDNTEFTFGLSKDIAFKNLQANNAFATVAMVYRSLAGAGFNKVFFVVYDKVGKRLDTATLDRVGILYNNAFHASPQQSLAGLGTPGTNFNNHIPSNCISCHGGQPYNTTNGTANAGTGRNEIGSLFLPFDLDQFDYDAINTRDGQQAQFRALNQIVRKVALDSGSDFSSSLVNQIDGWYGNTSHSATLSGNFNSNYLPPGWDPTHGATAGAPAVYREVVRGACRNCHVVNDKLDANGQPFLHFDDEATFAAQLARTAVDLKAFAMPHSLQSVRSFWQSSQQISLRTYMTGLNTPASNSANTVLQGAGPGNVATLDPPALLTTLIH